MALADTLLCFFAAAEATYWSGETKISMCPSEISSCIIDGRDSSKIEFAIWFETMPWYWNFSDRCEMIVLLIITNNYHYYM
jgi:hypothetical protein